MADQNSDMGVDEVVELYVQYEMFNRYYIYRIYVTFDWMVFMGFEPCVI